MWIVVVGEDVDNVKTNLVAVRSTYATAVDVLEWHKTTDGVYKAKLTKAQRKSGKKEKRDVNAISRFLVVEVTLKQPWAGRNKIKIANVHLHFMTAKAQRLRYLRLRGCLIASARTGWGPWTCERHVCRGCAAHPRWRTV